MTPTLPARYTPSRLLGEGATGVVWRARDRRLDTDVAVKIIKPNLAMHRRFRARFAREVAMSARIVHPHVVPVIDTGVLGSGEPFVVLGFAEAGSFADRLGDRDRSLRDNLRILDETLRALGAIHASSLLHQDLKPGNILLNPEPSSDGPVLRAWVADLGVADALAELNRDRKAVGGTPTYMAPEQLVGRTQDLGPWTDLYAMGLILWETVVGKRPHPGEGRQELLEFRSKGPPPLPEDAGVPPLLAELVLRLLDPEPRQRIDRAADVRRALRAALHELDAAAPAAGAPGPSRPTAQPTGEYPLQAPSSGASDGVRTAIRYTRVAPDPMPHQPPPEAGGNAPARASLPLLALREVPLIGRERERKVLWDAAREVAALAEPRLVLVVGESGSGKSRLVESTARALDEGGWMEVVRLRYHAPPGPDDGYRGAVRDLLVPWNDTRDGIETRLTRWIARDRDQEPGEVHEEAETLARWCGYLREGEPPVSDAVGLAYLYRHLDTRVWRGGACVVLEDAHNAQAAGDGLAIAEAILDRTVGERPVLVLCTLSAEALQSDPAVRRKVDALLERGARRIGLRRLGLTDTRRVVDESLLLDPELARAVALECEGAPLAAGLLLREWASREALVPDARGRFALRKGASLQDEIPSGVDALVRRRIQSALDRSPETAAADALALTALAGQEPPASLVRAIADAGLDTLLTTGLVAEQRGALVFEHSSVHAMAIDRAARLPHLKELHAKLATAWQELGERTGLDVAPHVGMHRLRSGDPDGALGPLLAAARTMTLGGRARDAVRAAALAIEAADATAQPAGQLEARRLHAEALVEAGEPARGAPLLTYALRGGEGDRLGRARLRLALGRAARKTGDHETAHRELEGAWAAFDALRDRVGLLSVATQRAKLLRAEGRHHLSATHWADVLRLNRGDLTVEAEALNGLVEALILEGRLENVDREALRLQRVSRASGDTRRVAEAAATMGILCLVRDAHDEAERHLVAASATAATLGADRLHARCRMLLGRVYRRRHRLDDAEDVASWLVRFASERGMHVTEAEGRVELAHVWLERGDHARAAEALEAGARALEGTPRHGLWVQVSLLHALLAAERDDEAACVAAWERAREHGLDPSAPPRDVWPIVDTLGRTVMVRAWRTMAARLADRGHDDTEEAVMIDE